MLLEPMHRLCTKLFGYLIIIWVYRTHTLSLFYGVNEKCLWSLLFIAQEPHHIHNKDPLQFGC